MNPTPHIIESALLLLAAFLIGCVVGYVLRKIFNKSPSVSRPVDATPEPESKPAVVSNTAGTVTAPQTATADSPVDQRPTVKKKAPSKSATAKIAAKRPATRKTAATSKPLKASASAATTPKPVKSDAPALLDAPRGGVADDLKKIKGIGPKLETLLNQNGVYHYDQIAAWNPKAVAIMDEKLSFRGRIEREEWITQAKALYKKS